MNTQKHNVTREINLQVEFYARNKAKFIAIEQANYNSNDWGIEFFAFSGQDAEDARQHTGCSYTVAVWIITPRKPK